MKIFVVLWVNSGLEQRKEYVLQHLGKIRDQFFGFENITETQRVATDREGDVRSSRWKDGAAMCFSLCAEHSLYSGHLDHPAHVWGVHSVVNEPPGETGPFFRAGAVDGKPRLCVLVLALLQIMGHFLPKGQRSSAPICLSVSALRKLRYLYDAGEIVSAGEVVGFQEDLPQLAGPNGVVL